MAWSDPFPAPIQARDGQIFNTLHDAAVYITSLLPEEQTLPAWRNAAHVLIQAADHGGPIEFARLGMMQALRPKAEPAYHSASKDPVWRNNRKLARNR